MAEHLPIGQLATVRRFEAAGFRAWPAQSVHYDGAWLIRLTPGHPAKRLNSVNPLDPGDCGDLAQRVMRAAQRFEACGRKLTFRLSPLAGQALSAHLDAAGWSRFSESLVMRLPIEKADLDDVIQQIPMQDVGRFVAAAAKVHRLDAERGAGLGQVIGAIRPEKGLFALERGDDALATAICVQDGDLAGLFEIGTLGSERGQGHARRMVLSAIKWARLKGARTAWLQVEADNEPAIALYRSLGFEEIYRYRYRQPPGEPA